MKRGERLKQKLIKAARFVIPFAKALGNQGIWYNNKMKNWSVDTSRFDKNSSELEIWQLEQLLNFGLSEGETIDKEKLKKHLSVLRIDQETRNFLEFVLYDKKPSHQQSDRIS